mgnify:CR=1 FL=1
MKTKVYKKWEKNFYDSPFFKQLIQQIDDNKLMSVSGIGDDGKIHSSLIPSALWNLALSVRDLGLWKSGIKPHRFWKVSDVKYFYNLSGNAEKIYNDLVCVQKMIEEKKSQ